MDSTKRAPQQGSPRGSPRATRPGGATKAGDENVDPSRPVSAAGNASPLRKKVFGERNGGRGIEVATPPPPQLKPVPSPPPTLTGRGAGAYDPKTNYTTPRPEFLRYDPERHREMLLRLARSAAEDDPSSSTSSAAASEAAGSSVSSAPGSGSEAELVDDDEEEEEEEVVPARSGRWARRLFLLLVAVACSCCYMYCMNPTPFPVHSEDGLDLTGQIGGMYDASVHELDSMRLLGLGPLYMMGPEDVLEETASQNVQGDSVGAVHQNDHIASPRNLIAIEMMGLVDMCPSVQLGESACRIGDVNGENLDVLEENSEVSEQDASVKMIPFENDARSISCHSIGSTSTQTIDMEGGSSGSVHQEEGKYYSNHSVLQLVSMEQAIGSVSDKLESRMGLESEGLDLDTELWQYEQTAEAAKEICSKVMFLWSAMELHLFQILACLSAAGLVATLFKYYLRSRETAVPASQQMSSKPLREVPVLVPHQTVQLPVSPSHLAPQLPVSKQDPSGSLEVPMQLPLLRSGLFVSSQDTVQLALPKTDPSVKAPVVDHGNCVEKLQKGNAETMKVSHDNFQFHRDNDSSKPPVVELLGEFKFGDSLRGKSIRNMNQHAGHVSVQESSEPLGEDVGKMPNKSSILQTPSVGRARKKENASKGDKDATLTPLRRSNRLRNKVTSP